MKSEASIMSRNIVRAFFFVVTCQCSLAMTAYDCGLPNVNLTSISLVSTPDCVPDVNQTTSSRVRVSITQNRLFQEVQYYRCSVETNNLVSRCGKTIDTLHSGALYSEIIKLTRDECKDMVEKGTYRLFTPKGPLDMTTKDGLTQLSLVTRGSINQGSCTPGDDFEMNGRIYDRPIVNTHITIKYSKGMGVVDVEEKTITVGSTKFPLDLEQAFDAESGYIFWSIPVPDCSGPSPKSIVYEGYAENVYDRTNGHQFIQVTHSGYDFQILLENRSTYICGLLSHYTEHPKLFVTFLSNDQPLMDIKNKVGPRDVNMLNYVNSKIVYSFRHVRASVLELFRMFKQDRCKTNNRITQNLMTLALLSPKEFAFAYGGPGYTAVTRGEVVYLAKCTPVIVFPDRSQKGCFNELPVIYKNSTFFMSPRSRILLEVGSPVECLADMRPKFKIQDGWFYASPDGLSETVPPNTITVEPLEFEFRDNSHAREGIYDSELLEKYQRAIVSPVVREIITARVVSAISGENNLPSGYQMSYAFNPIDYDKIKDKVGGFWENFSSKAKSTGSWFGFFIMIFAAYKSLIYMLSCFLNFRELRKEVGFLLAIPLCLVEAVTNLMLHNRIFKNRNSKDSTDPEAGDDQEPEGLRMYPLLKERC